MIDNLLKNSEFKRYYLDHMEHTLDTTFNEEAISGKIGREGGDGLWERVRHAAYLESDSSNGPVHTGRQWSNDEVYRHGYGHHESRRGNQHTEGIVHYVRMRHDSARAQLTKLRETIPAGSSGAEFSGGRDPLPSVEG